MGNSRFRVIVDLHAAAIVEAYNLTSETHHTLNLVETTPENPDSLKNDIHTASDIPPAVPGVSGENLGWTSLGATGPLTGVEFLEMGPPARPRPPLPPRRNLGVHLDRGQPRAPMESPPRFRVPQRLRLALSPLRPLRLRR